MNFFKIKITRKPLNTRLEQHSYLSKDLINLRNNRLAKYLNKFYISAGFKTNQNQIINFLKSFEIIFIKQPISNLNKGMGYNNSLITYIFLKLISPKEIIESGILRGYTTYLIDRSIGQNSKIYSYDINLSLIEFKSKKAKYFEGDVTNDKKMKNYNVDTAIFDDHVSHYDRILFSEKHNIQNIILDDDVSILTLHSDGWPPIPSANMIYNYEKIPKNLKWIYKENTAKANIKNLNTSNIIKKYKYIKYPNLFEFTGYKNTSETSILLKKKNY